MNGDRENESVVEGEGSEASGASAPADSRTATQGPSEPQRGLLHRLTLLDVLKLVTLIAAVVGPTAAAYFSFSSQVQKINAAAAERNREVDGRFDLLRTGVLHLQEFQPETVPYFANGKGIPDKLQLGLELARCEVVDGRVDTTALTCVKADGLLTSAAVASGRGVSTTPGIPPPSVVLSPPDEQQPPP